MNALIEQAAADVVSSFEKAREAVSKLDRVKLDDLQHECRDLRNANEFTTRTGAHVVESAIVMELEQRRETGKK